jgi:hypothetical protein
VIEDEMKNFMFIRKTVWLLSFLLIFQAFAQVTRQPYLQVPTPTSVIIRWQSGTGDIGTIRYGTSLPPLSKRIAESEDERIYHHAQLTGLAPNTKYYYTVDGSSK